MRGIADVAGYIRQSNNFMGMKRRVYIEVPNDNWLLPVDICELLQQDMDVPVQLIQWGHPNVREPHVTSRSESWAREHQIKIFAEAFVRVGFNIEYKRRMLEHFAEDDAKLYNLPIVPCNPHPNARKKPRAKPRHPGEQSQRLPSCLRGRHFDSYWHICTALGCKQVRPPKPEERDLLPLEPE